MDRLIEFAQHHSLLVAAAVLAALLVVAYETYLRRQSAQAVTPQELIRLMNQGALVLDLRPPDQYAAGHINGARQMSSDAVLKAADTLKKHKEKPVVVYCDAGSVGAAAVRQLAAQGFTKVFSLRGGLGAWRAENLPLARA
ncbi:MAG TPA: rhodanese-like domain-containing protein [Steroidobacteraceae bacterium]|nr:rhodanese-like domain-containing protein [Steroidobacteraceae bacterium]